MFFWTSWGHQSSVMSKDFWNYVYFLSLRNARPWISLISSLEIYGRRVKATWYSMASPKLCNRKFKLFHELNYFYLVSQCFWLNNIFFAKELKRLVTFKRGERTSDSSFFVYLMSVTKYFCPVQKISDLPWKLIWTERKMAK